MLSRKITEKRKENTKGKQTTKNRIKRSQCAPYKRRATRRFGENKVTAVINTVPLIYLEKLGIFHLLKQIFGLVIIPEIVRKEVVNNGKRYGLLDVLFIEQAIEEGWLMEIRAKNLPLLMKLQAEDLAVIAIAKEKKINEVIIDRKAARTAAIDLGLTPKGTIYVLLEALAIKEITLNEFKKLLKQLSWSGFYLRKRIYLEAIKKAKEIAQM